MRVWPLIPCQSTSWSRLFIPDVCRYQSTVPRVVGRGRKSAAASVAVSVPFHALPSATNSTRTAQYCTDIRQRVSRKSVPQMEVRRTCLESHECNCAYSSSARYTYRQQPVRSPSRPCVPTGSRLSRRARFARFDVLTSFLCICRARCSLFSEHVQMHARRNSCLRVHAHMHACTGTLSTQDTP